VVECDLAKVEVAGSNPVSRSRDSKALASVRGFAVRGDCSSEFVQSRSIRWKGRGSQVVRQRSAKPLFASSILARASNLSITYITHCFLRAAVWLPIAGEFVFGSASFAAFPLNFELSVVAANSADSSRTWV